MPLDCMADITLASRGARKSWRLKRRSGTSPVVPEIKMPCGPTCGTVRPIRSFGCGNPVGDCDMDYPRASNFSVGLLVLGGLRERWHFSGDIAFWRRSWVIFPGKYIHCGGDEVVASGDTQWNTYSADVAKMASLGITPNGSTSIVAYQHWFSTNIASFVQANGRMMMGWTEFENGGILTNAALMDWEITLDSSRAVAGGSPA